MIVTRLLWFGIASILFLSGCDPSPPSNGVGVTSVDNAGRPAFEVSKAGKRVALVTFDWESDHLAAGSSGIEMQRGGQTKVTLMLADPDGNQVEVILTESAGEISSEGDVDRVTIQLF